jgi:predicted HTH transcriptional regulator/tetratricopeptide (TPR) repeat protein
MKIKILKEALLLPENQNCEFESQCKEHIIGEIVCGFLNTTGGYLVCGVKVVNDEATLLGVDNRDFVAVNSVQQALQEGLSPKTLVSIQDQKIEGKTLLVIKVPAGRDLPYAFRNVIYLREGQSTYRADVGAIREMVLREQVEPERWERRYSSADLELDIDKDEIRKAVKDIQRLRRAEFKDAENPYAILEYLAVAKYGRLTNGGDVLFGMNPAIRSPQIRVRAACFPTDKASSTFQDMKSFEGPLVPILNETRNFIIRNTPTIAIFSKNKLQRRDESIYPPDAIREGLINAFAHRDYADFSGGISVHIYPRRLEIWNSGSLPPGITPELLIKGHKSVLVNPDISHVLYLRGFMEKLGRGSVLIMEGCKKLGLPQPEWTSGEKTGVTLTFFAPEITIQMPSPPQDFTDRDEELRELQAKFAGSTNIIGLRGIGGVGKTALALKLAESLRDSYPDGQVMVDMRGTSGNPTTPTEAMASVIHAYHPAEKIPEKETDVKIMYLRVLEDKHALLLLDNALDDKQVLKLFPPKNCGLLVTSRKIIKLPGLYRMDLDVLKEAEAKELLQKVWSSTSASSERYVADPTWSDIARLCGFLPLALRAAASYLANSEDISPTKYAEELKDERTRLELIGNEGVELNVDASFNLSFQRLPLETQQIFLNASIFPADFDAKAEEQVCQDEGHKGLSELLRWSLVDYKPLGPDHGRYKVHDLARLFASARQSDESKAIVRERHAEYYRELLSAANNLYLKGRSYIKAGLSLFDREKANIMAGQAWASENSETNSSAAILCMSYPDAGFYVLDLRLHPREKIDWLETALAAVRQIRDRSMEGKYLGNLGRAHSDLGETRKAIRYYEQALTIDRDIEDRRGEGADLGNLGRAYSDLDEPRKAIEYNEQALTIDRDIEDRRGEGADLGNLGRAYSDLGEPRKAIEYNEQALALARQIGDRRGEGADLGNLGRAYSDLGETRKAIKYYKQALKISREIGDLWSEGNRLGNLGRAHSDLGETRKAIEYHEQALKISREIGDRRGEGNRLANLGRAYSDLGEMRKAIKYNEQALRISHEIGDRRGEGKRLHNLGRAYSDLGETRKAIKYNEQALALARQIEDRRSEVADLGNLGIAYRNLGDAKMAIDYHEQAIAIARDIEDKQNEGEELCNLGKAYLDLNETNKAIEYCTESLDIVHKIEYRKIEGDSFCTLGNAYSNLGQMDKAIDLYDQALKIFKKMEYRRGVGEAQFKKSQALYKLGRRKEAAYLANQALQILQQVESPQAEKVLEMLAK